MHGICPSRLLLELAARHFVCGLRLHSAISTSCSPVMLDELAMATWRAPSRILEKTL